MSDYIRKAVELADGFSINKKCPACSDVESEPVPDKQEQDDG